MRITDELRKYTEEQIKWLDMTKVHYHKLFSIADRIDAEHESKVSYWQKASYKDGYDEGFASADDYFTDKRKTLEEHGWIRLPLDADGKPIHAGDMLDGYGKTIEVVEIRHGRSGWVLISRDGNGYADTFAFTHHHVPTVEDVLEEMLREYDRDDTELTNGEIIERFAAKLQLKEG